MLYQSKFSERSSVQCPAEPPLNCCLEIPLQDKLARLPNDKPRIAYLVETTVHDTILINFLSF